MVNAQTKIRSREWDAKNSLWFQVKNGLPNPGQKTRPNVNINNNNKEKKLTI